MKEQCPNVQFYRLLGIGTYYKRSTGLCDASNLKNGGELEAIGLS
jgi:hypothetical protein